MAKERVKARKAQAAAERVERQQRQRRASAIRRAVLGSLLVAAIGGTGYCVIKDRQLTGAITTANYSAGQHLPGPLIPVAGAGLPSIVRQFGETVFPIDPQEKKQRDVSAVLNVAKRLRELLDETRVVPKKLAAEVGETLDRLLEQAINSVYGRMTPAKIANAFAAEAADHILEASRSRRQPLPEPTPDYAVRLNTPLAQALRQFSAANRIADALAVLS